MIEQSRETCVVFAMKNTPQVALGIVTSSYVYREDQHLLKRHRVAVLLALLADRFSQRSVPCLRRQFTEPEPRGLRTHQGVPASLHPTYSRRLYLTICRRFYEASCERWTADACVEPFEFSAEPCDDRRTTSLQHGLAVVLR